MIDISSFLRELERDSEGLAWVEHRIYANRETYILSVPGLAMWPEFTSLAHISESADKIRQAIKLRKELKSLQL